MMAHGLSLTVSHLKHRGLDICLNILISHDHNYYTIYYADSSYAISILFTPRFENSSVVNMETCKQIGNRVGQMRA